MNARPRLIVIESLSRATREYLLASIASRYDVWLLQHAEPDWEKRYLAGWTVVDTLDGERMARAARTVGAAGVLCWDEVRLEAAAVVARRLGLPGSDPQAVRRCRDKHLTRTALAAAGVPQPASEVVGCAADAAAAATRIGYPVVLKPRALAGSYGVIKVGSPHGLAGAFAHASGASLAGVAAFPEGVLVEEFADGEEISVDAICQQGRVTPLFVARKRLGFPPYFEEIGHLVDGRDPLARSGAIHDLLAAAHAAVGLSTAWTHTEIRLTASGPKIIEINARIGGDMIPYLGQLATGVDPGLVAAAVACGQPPPIAAARSESAAIHFIYPPRDMAVAGVRVREGALPAGTDEAVPLVQPGQQVCLPPRGHISGRVAYVIVRGATAAECGRLAWEAAAAVEVEAAAAAGSHA